MNLVKESLELEACIDCTMLIANDDDNPDLSEVEQNEIRKARHDFEVFNNCHLCIDPESLGFSWYCCDICQRPLAGDRYKAIGI